METHETSLRPLIEEILDRARQRYIDGCRSRVDAFCDRNFSVQGAWRIHQKAMGHDLWKAPVNALWALPYLATQGVAALASRLGFQRTATRLEGTPPGFKTAVAHEIEWLIYTELLQLPIWQKERHSTRDGLLEAVMADPEMTELLLSELMRLEQLGHRKGSRLKLEDYLMNYVGSRNAASDLAGSLLSVATGAATFRTFTPGAVALGTATAVAVAQELAIAQFALGPALGSLYYGLFPAAASTGLIALSIGGLMATLGILTAFSGVVTDPLQKLTGLHQRRLVQLLKALEQELRGQKGHFRLHDAYVARSLDVVDLIRGAVQAMK